MSVRTWETEECAGHRTWIRGQKQQAPDTQDSLLDDWLEPIQRFSRGESRLLRFDGPEGVSRPPRSFFQLI